MFVRLGRSGGLINCIDSFRLWGMLARYLENMMLYIVFQKYLTTRNQGP